MNYLKLEPMDLSNTGVDCKAAITLTAGQVAALENHEPLHLELSLCGQRENSPYLLVEIK